jgi:hypothetical protein
MGGRRDEEKVSFFDVKEVAGLGNRKMDTVQVFFNFFFFKERWMTSRNDVLLECVKLDAERFSCLALQKTFNV